MSNFENFFSKEGGRRNGVVLPIASKFSQDLDLNFFLVIGWYVISYCGVFIVQELSLILVCVITTVKVSSIFFKLLATEYSKLRSKEIVSIIVLLFGANLRWMCKAATGDYYLILLHTPFPNQKWLIKGSKTLLRIIHYKISFFNSNAKRIEK